jgi:hypothetical protein
MPPAKRKPIVKEEPKPILGKKGICYCSTCENRGELVYELVWKCKEGVNAPYGNHSVMNCKKFK